jgi:ribosomal protein S18 acetylase RimI-like enzyme
MVRPNLEGLPSTATLPADYGWRTFRPGDELTLIHLLETGDFGTWDEARLLAGERAPLPHHCTVFLTYRHTPVAVAFAFLHPHAVELSWVVVHPEHRGRGLCRSLCARTLEGCGRF